MGVESGGAVAAFGAAAAVAEEQGDALVLGVVAASPAQIERDRGAAEDGGDDSCFAGEPAGHAGADAVAGVEDAGFLQPAGEGVFVDDHHDGGVDAAGGGESVGGVALDQFAQRPAECLGSGSAFDAGALGGGEVLGCGQGHEDLLEGGGVVGRQGEPAVGGAVAVVGHRERAGPQRGRLLSLEDVGFVGVGIVGGDDLPQPTPQPAQCLGVVMTRLGDQVRLGLGEGLGAASASRVRGCCSRSWPSRTAPYAAARVVFVWWASQFAALDAPTPAPT
nr:hypothetical protein [Nocardioides sp. LMS-CY]